VLRRQCHISIAETFLCHISIRSPVWKALGLFSAYNTLHSSHISSDCTKKIFRISHTSNLTNIRTRASV